MLGISRFLRYDSLTTRVHAIILRVFSRSMHNKSNGNFKTFRSREKKNGQTHDLDVHRLNLIHINSVVSTVNLKNQTIVHLTFSN